MLKTRVRHEDGFFDMKRECGYEYDLFARCIKLHDNYMMCRQLFECLDQCMSRARIDA